MKNAMTNFDIAAILPELRRHTIGGHIDNVYQITQEIFLLKIRPGNLNLVIEPGKRIHLTKFELKTPAKPSQLCMAFRKHIKSAKIIGLEQPHFERVVLIEIETQGKRLKIVAELLPRGNIILVDEQDRVVVSSRYARMKDRSILRGQPLRLPPQRGKNLLEATISATRELRSASQVDAVRALAQVYGVSGIFAEEILQRAEVDKTASAGTLSDDQIESIYRAITQVRDALLAEERSPAIVLENDHTIDVVPFALELYGPMQKRTFANFNDAVDEYFTNLSSSKLTGQRERAYLEKRQQLERRLEAQKKQLQEITGSAAMLRIEGDLIFRHLRDIQAVQELVTESRRSKRPLKEIKESVFKHGAELDTRGDKVAFVFDENQIEVEVRRRPQDQAAELYQKAKRLESKLSGLKTSTRETELLLEKLVAKEIELRQPVKPEERPVKEWFEKFRWFYSSDGLLIIGGRDATSNEVLLKRHTNPEDFVMHAEVHGAPFFVMKTGGVQPTAETLRETAQACVSFSRFWKEGIRSGDAYWVRPEQVTKRAPAGEYLGRGAFMIRGTRNYVRGVEVALALGVTERDSNVLLMSGPPSAVRSQCQTYVEIYQGRVSPAEAARKILAILRKKASETIRSQLIKVTMDDVIRLFPAGGFDILNSISP
jgi:predicted ribosome quality control (RQC) complex YloA/Tae2 family protein